MRGNTFVLLKAQCLGKLKSIPLDSDYNNDSLSYCEEIIYNTSPDVVDVDGDGYSDGDEVKAGYNSNGKGLL